MPEDVTSPYAERRLERRAKSKERAKSRDRIKQRQEASYSEYTNNCSYEGASLTCKFVYYFFLV